MINYGRGPRSSIRGGRTGGRFNLTVDLAVKEESFAEYERRATAILAEFAEGGFRLLASGSASGTDFSTFHSHERVRLIYNLWDMGDDADSLLAIMMKLADDQDYFMLDRLVENATQELVVPVRLRRPDVPPMSEAFRYVRLTEVPQTSKLAEYIARFEETWMRFQRRQGWNLISIAENITGTVNMMTSLWQVPVDHAVKAQDELTQAPWSKELVRPWSRKVVVFEPTVYDPKQRALVENHP